MHYPVYEQPNEFSEVTGILQHLSPTELQQLLDDDDKLEELIKDTEQVKRINVEKQTLLANNKSLADFNLSKEPRLTELKTLLVSTYEVMDHQKQDFLVNKTQLDEFSTQTSIEEVVNLMKVKANEIEEQSEVISDRLFSRQMDIQNFVDRFLATRTKMHVLKAKCQKLEEMLRQQQQQQRQHTTSSHAAANYYTPPYPQYSNYMQ